MNDFEKFKKIADILEVHPFNHFDIKGHSGFDVFEDVLEDFNELKISAFENKPIRNNIIVGFIVDSSPNGFAIKHDGDYYIAINSGLVYFMSLLAGRIGACKNCFPNLDFIENEFEKLPLVDWSNMNAEKAFRSGIIPVFSDDPKRKFYSIHIFKQILLFIFGHEIAHILRGHCDFIDNEIGNKNYFCFNSSTSSEINIIRQAIEIDADRRSASSRLTSCVNTINDVTGECRLPDWLTKDMYLNSVLHSIFYFFFYICDDSEVSDINHQQYPDSYSRIWFLEDYCQYVISELLPSHKTDDIVKKSLFDTSQYFSNIGCNFNVFEKLIQKKEFSFRYGSWIFNKLGELIPKMHKFSYEEL